ncbi:MAG: hypothetical protein IJP43_08170 [Oscillospiraceae bacterium]|nr:hypothetical protein [Oscillospiraceae bacterium]
MSVLENGDCAARGHHSLKTDKMSFLEDQTLRQFVMVGDTVTGTTIS